MRRPRWHRRGRAPHTKAGRGTRTSGLAGVVTVVLATLRVVVAPILGAAVVPGTIGLIALISGCEHLDSGYDTST